LSRQKHIVVISSFLNFVGGYERIVANFVNLLAEKGENITLLLLADTDESFYPLHKKVCVVQLPLHFGITPKGNMISRKVQMLKDLLRLRKTLKELKPSFLICTEYHYAVAGVLTAEIKKTQVFSWEHTHFAVSFKNKFWRVLCDITYPKLDGIICLNPDEKKLFNHLNKNVVVIPNFIHLPGCKASLQNKSILTIARLTAVKGIDYLLEAAKLVLTKHPDWKWKLIGEGELQSIAEEFIKNKDLKNKLVLQAPSNHNISAEYENASMYVMTSLNECFPMVLMEALSYGLPCISFDCDTGPRHIIHNNADGLLVEKENPQTMADAIDLLIEDEEERIAMGANALVNSKRFSPETVYPLWENLFNDNSSSER
jgi:glycosyltransferase involved in cell wall biosynthesis